MTYAEAEKTRATLEKAMSDASAAYTALGGGSGPTGLTPDAIRLLPEVRAAKAASAAAFRRLQDHNAFMVKTFSREMKAARDERRGGRK